MDWTIQELAVVGILWLLIPGAAFLYIGLRRRDREDEELERWLRHDGAAPGVDSELSTTTTVGR